MKKKDHLIKSQIGKLKWELHDNSYHVTKVGSYNNQSILYNDLPDFVIVTGENDSRNTQRLNYLVESYKYGKEQDEEERYLIL